MAIEWLIAIDRFRAYGTNSLAIPEMALREIKTIAR